MYSQQPTRVLTSGQCHFKAEVDWTVRLPSALRAAQAVEDLPRWNVNNARGVLRNSDLGVVLLADHRLIQLQSSSVAYWNDRLVRIVDLLERMLAAMDVKECELFRFETRWYARLEMSHAEIVDLALRAFAPDRSRLAFLCGTPTDFVPRFHGRIGDFRVITSLFPMLAEEVEHSLRELPNLEYFKEDDKIDSVLHNLQQALSRDSLLVLVEVLWEKPRASDVGHFFRSALKVVEQVSDNAVNLLRALEPRHVDVISR